MNYNIKSARIIGLMYISVIRLSVKNIDSRVEHRRVGKFSVGMFSVSKNSRLLSQGCRAE